MPVELFIHKMSEHMESARIVRWLVEENEPVQQFQILMEVETDKAIAELESPATGVLKGIRAGAEDGAEIKVGEVIAYIAAPGESVPSLPPLGTPDVSNKNPSPHTLGENPDSISLESPERASQDEFSFPLPGTVSSSEGIRATPVARRVAKDLGIKLSEVQGTGPEGRIKEEDVRAYAEKILHTDHLPNEPNESSRVSPESSLELTHNQRLTAQRMLESIQTAPQFALTLSADMTQTLRLKESFSHQTKTGFRPSITAILVKVVAEALKRHPRVNSSYKDDRIETFPQINIAIALASGGELVAPVIQGADKQSIEQVNHQIEVFQEKGQRMRFGLDDLSGGTFTISNLGMYGIERFNAIIIPGQSAILAVGKIVKTPVALEDSVLAIRPMISLTLTADHRVLDGVQAAQFVNEIKQLLENPSFLT